MNIQTSDKSFTLFSQVFQEHYHSTQDGALQETLHKHILPSFYFHKNKRNLKILDICFGLGYNTLCAINYAYQNGIKALEIHSPEMDRNLIQTLLQYSYPKELDTEILSELTQRHFYQKGDFKVFLHLGDAREILKGFQKKQMVFDIVFQDAFSPNKNKLLWTYEYFKTLFLLTSKDCIITTYSQNSSMLYSAFLAGFKSYTLKQANTRDSIVLTKTQEIPCLESSNILEVLKVDISHKIATNKNLVGLYDEG
ncbi:hypothetical protein BA917_04465 [Helicobacter pullorum]|uniref:tRNA (5-methylaminomethyl-2-thiouridine)(34)-methyltransferase MnmD n=1 Tax=Helicobacter pullorum TaxID=35818 RepID=UPI0008169BE2|nr:MnmC family methyltransferase [Helicobacter pullorum]OCR11039.1 hypothetical protein A7X13_01190 [Helicobacter pullorum]OCR20622.1 hypothetical protein BA917_04465 [Helicobacter pullorum]